MSSILFIYVVKLLFILNTPLVLLVDVIYPWKYLRSSFNATAAVCKAENSQT
jgi:hypothetical protein